MKRRCLLLFIFLTTTAISTRACWLMGNVPTGPGDNEGFWKDATLATAFPGFLVEIILPHQPHDFDDDYVLPSVWHNAWAIAPAAGLFWTGFAWIILAGNSFLARHHRPQSKLASAPHA